MKIRFQTKDCLTCICDIVVKPPISVIMRPLWDKVKFDEETTIHELTHRRYEFCGEVKDGIPTVVEV